VADREDFRPSWQGIDLGQWSPGQPARFETAEEVLRLLCGWSGERLRRAEAAPHPDPDQVERLRAQHEEYLAASRQLNGQDAAGVQRIIDDYGPVARQILGRA
jgi:hypothetical protein